MALQYARENVPNVLGLGATLGIAYILVTAIYRLYFHPLAKFPGPFFARISTFPSYWHTIKQDRHVWLFQLQEQYGPNFRYSPDAVLFNTPAAFRHIYGPKGNTRKSEYYKIWPKTVDALNTWSVTDVPSHARKRRVLNYAFSEKALKAAEPFIQTNTNRWLDLMDEQVGKGADKGWSTPFNMAEWLNFLVFDILGDLCFGENFNMKEPESKLRHIPELMVGFLALLHPIGYSPFRSFYVWMKPRGLDWLMAVIAPPAIKSWQDFVDKCLADRTKVEQQLEVSPKPEGEVRKDFFHWLFKAVDPETGERGYDLNELYAESELLIIAGSDTTSIVMSAMMFYLVRNPTVQSTLEHEILSTFSSYDDIASGPRLNSCKYMHAFITEAMRMCPPVAAELSREVMPGGTCVDGHFIPAGMQCSTGMYCLSYNKDYFPSPTTFRPERWLVEHSGEDAVTRAEGAFCSFSSGSRGCVGKNLAWLEMKIVLAKLIFRFEVRRQEGNNLGGGDVNARLGRRNVDQYQTYDLFVSGRDGPVVQVKPRVHG
ncbi:cytochrome P450 [Polyplosphaeria fusca]|uniref:Cytochrome P450 n=1 Tax=Polyplosphaeria fusca TaxID=682080 RepID=A0A9P4QY39_9PLEO|nr:cytochrome P450 [Polyplosphaeria fusca]